MENNSKYQSSEEEVIDIRELVARYAKKWYWFLLAAAVAVLLANIYLRTTVPQYEVQTTILLRGDDDLEGGSSQLSMLKSMGLMSGSKEVEDEMLVINSNKIVLQTIDSLNLYQSHFVKDGLRYIETYKNNALLLDVPKAFNSTIKNTLKLWIEEDGDMIDVELHYGKEVKEHYRLNSITDAFTTPIGVLRFKTDGTFDAEKKSRIEVLPLKKLISVYRSKLNVATVNKESKVIKISVVESNITKARDFLDLVVRLYNLDAIVDKNLMAQSTAHFVNERLVLISQELTTVENEVESFKQRNGLTDITSEAGLYLETASEYQKKIAELETQQSLISYVENYIQKNSTDLIPSNIGIEDKGVLDIVQEYNKVQMEALRLKRTSTDDNPVITQYAKQLEAIRGNILASLGSVKQSLSIAVSDVKNKENQFLAKIKNVPAQERKFISIKRQQEIKQGLYLMLLQKREENALSLAITAPSAKTIDKAYASLTPVAPKTKIIYLVALLLGLIVPFLIIYLRDLMDNNIQDVKELKKMVKVPYMGSVATSREGSELVVEEGKTTPVVEMIRLIRTNLQFVIGNAKNPIILVTSSISGEGKSFISINLAMSFALMKKKVALVGLDIRNPMLDEYLKFTDNKGVSNYLADDDVSLDAITIHQSGFHKNLDVVPAGPIPPNPAELLLNDRLEELATELKKRYDYIIIDSAPLGVVSDTYLVNRIVDNTLYIAREGYTPREYYSLINSIYDEQKIKGIGVVLNGVPTSTHYGYGRDGKYRYASKKFVPMSDRINDFIVGLFRRKP